MVLSALVQGCATERTITKRVSADKFLRQNAFKGFATDSFIGVTADRAYKEHWNASRLFHRRVIFWIPLAELPEGWQKSVTNQLADQKLSRE